MKKLHKLSKLLLIPIAGIFSLTINVPVSAKGPTMPTLYGSITISNGIETPSSASGFCYGMPEDASGIANAVFIDTNGSCTIVRISGSLSTPFEFSTTHLYYQSALGYQNAQCIVDGVPKASGEGFSLSPDSSAPTQIVCTAEPIPEPEPEFTLSMAVPDKVDLSILPTAEGKLGSESFDIVVTTDNPTGYTLSMYNESSDLVNDTASAIIPTLDNEAPKADFPVNRWGYSLDDVIYKPILKETKTVLKTTDAPDDEDITTFNLATKINTEKPAGSYSNTFVFMAVMNEPPIETLNIIGLGEIRYDPGMTWSEWINSEYNNLGLTEFETPNPYYGFCAQHRDLFPNPTDYLENCDGGFISTIGTTSSTIDNGPILWHMDHINGVTVDYTPININQPIELQTLVTNIDGSISDSIPATYVLDSYFADYGFGLFGENLITEVSHSSGNDTWRQWAEDYNDLGEYPSPNIIFGVEDGELPYSIATSYQGNSGIFFIKISEEDLISHDVDFSYFNFNYDAECAQVYQVQGILPSDTIVDDAYTIVPIL